MDITISIDHAIRAKWALRGAIREQVGIYLKCKRKRGLQESSAMALTIAKGYGASYNAVRDALKRELPQLFQDGRRD